jgi:hypothetical protein
LEDEVWAVDDTGGSLGSTDGIVDVGMALVEFTGAFVNSTDAVVDYWEAVVGEKL